MKLARLFKMILLACTFVFASSADEVASAYNYSYGQQVVLERMNDLRARNGAGRLVFDDALTRAADLRAKEIVEYFSHTRPNGRDCFSVLKEFNIKYNTCAENIAYGTGVDGEEVFNMWDNSPGHHRNMIGRKFTRVGIGFYSDGENNYWVQLFADGRANRGNHNNNNHNYNGHNYNHNNNHDYYGHNNHNNYGSHRNRSAQVKDAYYDCSSGDCDDEFYCEDCGVPLDCELVCPECGAEYELVDDDDYYGGCGSGGCY